MELKNIVDHADELTDKRVLVRLDLNVPIEDERILNDFRIKKIIPMLELVAQKNTRAILVSHHTRDGQSLRVVYERLKEHFPELRFSEQHEVNETLIEEARALPAGGMLLLENIRMFAGEEENSETLARALANLADVYINEAFAVAHRAHASVVGVPVLLPAYAGPLFVSEVTNLSRALNPEHPFYFILGGAKFSTKLPLVQKFLPLTENIFIYGALANNFFKARGYEVGTSLVDNEALPAELLSSEKVILPTDAIVKTNDGKKEERSITHVGKEESILDSGPESVAQIAQKIGNAKCILWNGPLGNYENGFTEGTEALAKILSESKAFTIVGGGDTLAAIEKLNLWDKFGFVSTGGGAMLDFLTAGTLVGIEALKK
jgi:phosphoglycerate kinase